MKKLLVSFLAMICLFGMVACNQNAEASQPESTPPVVPETIVDTIAPLIRTEYEYKVVLVNTEVDLPKVSFDETVTAKYELDGREVSPEGKYAPTTEGNSVYKITATDEAGNKTFKEVYYTATADAKDLNKIYALDTPFGLEKHAGTTLNGLNQMKVTLIKSGTERPVDLNGKTVPNLFLDENGNVVDNALSATETIDEYLVCNIQNTNARMVLDNPLYKNWNEQFSQMYFYVYNAGLKSATVHFNNYDYVVPANSGWVKVVIAPKTVDGVVVTDYNVISSLGGSYNMSGLFDLEDCVGANFRITAGARFERIMVTAIYGTPIQK